MSSPDQRARWRATGREKATERVPSPGEGSVMSDSQSSPKYVPIIGSGSGESQRAPHIRGRNRLASREMAVESRTTRRQPYRRRSIRPGRSAVGQAARLSRRRRTELDRRAACPTGRRPTARAGYFGRRRRALVSRPPTPTACCQEEPIMLRATIILLIPPRLPRQRRGDWPKPPPQRWLRGRALDRRE